jgi:anaerobic magnesium-protoporphyrin IX monomethyl ester cyclase
MYSMKRKALELARTFRGTCELLVAGGPQPTADPKGFLDDFDVAVIGEGEQTIVELAEAFERGADLSCVNGIAYRAGREGEIKFAPPRGFIQNLDYIPFPARESFDNRAYMEYYSRNYGYTTTSIMTSRGCPFQCDFCSRPVFGNEFRTRSASNIVDEMRDVAGLGYDRVWVADDCFTLNRNRLVDICEEIIRRRINLGWECLSRVDTVDDMVARIMKRAGCVRMFFGIESGNNRILSLMKKQITTQQAEKAVKAAKEAGIQVGAFFIVGYPGEDPKTVLDTVRFASSLPLDYLSFTMPYPIPGTPLHERVKSTMVDDEWEEPRNLNLVKHRLTFQSGLSESLLKLVIVKGMAQFYVRKYLGSGGYKLMGEPFEALSDKLIEHMR